MVSPEYLDLSIISKTDWIIYKGNNLTLHTYWKKENKMNRKSINPKELFNSMQHGFSQIVECKPGKLIFISGQVAWDEHSKIVGENDLEKQAKKAMDNLRLAIESVGGSLEDIV